MTVHRRDAALSSRYIWKMVLWTKKDAAADKDPRRFHILPPSGVAGTLDADLMTLQSAYSFLEDAHKAPCILGKTPLVVQRMTVLGIANDINYVVRAMALSMRKQHGGQLILLPPARAPSHGRVASNNRQSIASGRTLENAWHWLDGLPGASLSSIFTPSACQLRLQEQDEIGRLRALDLASRNSSLAKAAQSLGLGSDVFDATNGAVRALGRGMLLQDMPAQFRQHGMLWWWQVLTTYTVRVRGPIAERLQRHPSMLALSNRISKELSAESTTQGDWLSSTRAALAKAARGSSAKDFGYLPNVAFDAALHVRMGDACGPKAKRNQEIVRKCVLTLRAGLAPLLAHGVVPRGGRVFLATDSQSIVEQAKAAAASLPFSVYFLDIDRAKYDTEAWIELASAKSRSTLTILDETLLDLLFLSRSRYIAGSMYGNVPRLALQLRVTAPGDPRRLAYVTTDGRDWCTMPTCTCAAATRSNQPAHSLCRSEFND